ncbi:hypothetical protein MIMGU_mgv1a001615mg [Erythranthe guttata]|uniref:TF-B3 domain-containing protein n=1 Tax=Erythranthe guttata TaxID=4155 RepID=A0A022R972_ERYGU|nr:hypothetical protein MIMGU_mgv1a001615mg [Erythranthe guttata]
MGSKNCMNQLCRATTSSEWKKGWILKSGGFATLCYNCGSAYENSVFCETFHSDESGWRECRICGKLVHCGCIASKYLHEYMDFGGISCSSCSKRLEIHTPPSIQVRKIFTKSSYTVSVCVCVFIFLDFFFLQSRGDIPSSAFIPKSGGIRDARPIVIEKRIEEDRFSTERLLQLTKAIAVNEFSPESSKRAPNPSPHSSSVFAKIDSKSQAKPGVKDMFESHAQPSRNFSLTVPPLTGEKILEGGESSKDGGPKTRHVFSRPPKPTPLGAAPQARVARPPADGRGRNLLLPRYWPRITDQELQQLSGDLKSTIVPLFEKILSASDAGRIGRLVLPKACAEAYFPSINQSEGIPIKIQDIKGKEWIFQFRFWPNNNSRMYVLEGVTPCIQNMQLQAGDTVIFSRIDPGGQLVIGCRKTANNVDVQNGSRAGDDSGQQHLTLSEKRKAKNIKNKRLVMNNNEAMDLRITWDEAQELFRPSPSAERTVFVVEDLEIEEFEEPPVFGKRTMFVCGPSGEQEQVVQCDSCSKWRRLPVDALLSANWTCSDNIWDSTRCSCSAPEDINSRDLDIVNKDYKKRRISSGEGEPSGLDALANAAVLGGDNIGDMGGEYSVGATAAAATTTRHPRHRPGCTCIVCIQPPSGKGKHDPSCKCNVCLTVRRRFKTLMMRKKKRQSDREAELELALESEDIVGEALVSMNRQREENEGQNGNTVDLVEETSSKGHKLDLNCDPHREDEVLLEASGMSLTALMNAASCPLDDMYLVPQAANVVEENVADVEPEKIREDG